jgi:hypothetical protein
VYLKVAHFFVRYCGSVFSYKLKVFHEEKILTQFINTHYRENTNGIEGGIIIKEERL